MIGKTAEAHTISLTPFLFKTRERLAFRHINESSLKNKPYITRHYVFQPGKSTEQAISDVCHEIEKGLKRQKFSLAVFVDIAAAFDRLDWKAAIKAMQARKIDKNIINWYANYLKTRIAKVNIKGQEKEKQLVMGCQQGDILSVLIWNIVFDSLLNKFNQVPLAVLATLTMAA